MASSSLEPWRFVLLGKTGVGKSATGNTILGEKKFPSDTRAASVTTHCTTEEKIINQKKITIMDTPGLYDTNMSNEEIINKIVDGVMKIAPGPHAFLLVIDTRRFTEEEKNTVKYFQEIFGEGVHKHMIVLFTRGDDLEFDSKSIDTYISEAGPDLQQLIHSCGRRYHVFNNRCMDDRSQVDKLLEKVHQMLEVNNHEYYSYGLFKMAQEIKILKAPKEEKERRIIYLRIRVRRLKGRSSHRRCNIL